MSDFKQVGELLNSTLKKYNYQVAPLAPAGKPGKIERTAREYRLQFIDKQNDTSDRLVSELKSVIELLFPVAKNIKYNEISPNSSKFPSYSFFINNQKFDFVIARGANRGEKFEARVVTDMHKFFFSSKNDTQYGKLIEQMGKLQPDFGSSEVISVKQRTGSTKKEGVPIEKLGEIIGDIVITDSMRKNWFISLKDINGDTFSSYSGAASLFDSSGTLQPKSAGAEFLEAFGVDLNRVQAGFDQRSGKTVFRPLLPVKKPDLNKLKAIFERAWGMNYFYVRRKSNGWDVFWVDRAKLNKLAGNIKITDVKYPSKSSKQITILCECSEKKYTVEIRNSKAGEYPNDIKFKVR